MNDENEDGIARRVKSYVKALKILNQIMDKHVDLEDYEKELFKRIQEEIKDPEEQLAAVAFVSRLDGFVSANIDNPKVVIDKIYFFTWTLADNMDVLQEENVERVLYPIVKKLLELQKATEPSSTPHGMFG